MPRGLRAAHDDAGHERPFSVRVYDNGGECVEDPALAVADVVILAQGDFADDAQLPHVDLSDPALAGEARTWPSPDQFHRLTPAASWLTAKTTFSSGEKAIEDVWTAHACPTHRINSGAITQQLGAMFAVPLPE